MKKTLLSYRNICSFCKWFFNWKKISYAILVQNGYSIDSTNNEQKLFKAYKNAKFILSGSKDTYDCIKLKFPKLKNKILKVSYSLDLGAIDFKKKKIWLLILVENYLSIVI